MNRYDTIDKYKTKEGKTYYTNPIYPFIPESENDIYIIAGVSDRYDVIFNILPPSSYDLNLHKDWNEGYGDELFSSQTFRYSNVDFEEIAKANRD